MKKIKTFFTAATLCAATAVGYNAYQQETMTEQERLIQANIEALSIEESGGNVVDCFSSSNYKNGSTYYDCGNCTKQYNAEGVGSQRDCMTN